MPSKFVEELMLRDCINADEVDRLLMNAEDYELLEIINHSIGYDADKAREILGKRGVPVPESKEKRRDDS